LSSFPVAADLPNAGDVDRLARGQGIALWRQIEGVLEQSILQGEFAPTGRLPAEPELARRFGVNRHTVRQAVRALASRGILRIEQGRGTFVDMRPLDYTIGARTRFSSNLASRERLPSRVKLGIDEVELNGPIARALGLPDGSPGLRHRTLARADGIPVTLGTIYLPRAALPKAAAILAVNPSITALFTAAGHQDYRRAWTRIGTRLPSPDEAHQLEQSRDRPVLTTEALDTTAAGAPLAYNYTVWAGERVTLTVES
jgi:GntR family transcriptional regulator, phosphonate transport system regulatory protein